jgi:hypothetical protein|tara:strand:+ start:685 stop:918 length:234 start_codon:yes stop_codon:yes gene_type:complete
MVKLFTNEKEIKRAIQAAVDQANKVKKKKRSIHELCKEFPDKSYRELEKYRDNDRWEEAIGIGHNHPPQDPDNDEYE